MSSQAVAVGCVGPAVSCKGLENPQGAGVVSNELIHQDCAEQNK